MVRSLEELSGELDAHIRSIRDFPKAGINFRDIMPLFAQPALVRELCAAIAARAQSTGGVDAVAGLEARGFLFGPQVAIELGVPFVPIRKKGKLPGEVLRASYVKEYGEDVVEIQKDVVKPGARVLIVDDLLATGGTMKAAVELLHSAGAQLTEALVLIELVPLNGRKVLNGVPVHAVLRYDEA